MDRFRPIMMTTLAALSGRVADRARLRRGWRVAAAARPGDRRRTDRLAVHHAYVTPVIYLYLEEFQEKVLDRFSFFRSGRDRRTAEPSPAYALQEAQGD